MHKNALFLLKKKCKNRLWRLGFLLPDPRNPGYTTE